MLIILKVDALLLIISQCIGKYSGNTTIIKAIIGIMTLIFMSELVLGEFILAIIDFITCIIWILIHRRIVNS